MPIAILRLYIQQILPHSSMTQVNISTFHSQLYSFISIGLILWFQWSIITRFRSSSFIKIDSIFTYSYSFHIIEYYHITCSLFMFIIIIIDTTKTFIIFFFSTDHSTWNNRSNTFDLFLSSNNIIIRLFSLFIIIIISSKWIIIVEFDVNS
jgi:hypothetical protein